MLKSDKLSGTLPEYLSTFTIIPCRILPEKEKKKVQTRVVVKIKTHISCQIHVFRNCAFYEVITKNAHSQTGHRCNTVCAKKIQFALTQKYSYRVIIINPLNAELNPICHLLALLGVHHFLHVSRIRVNVYCVRLGETVGV